MAQPDGVGSCISEWVVDAGGRLAVKGISWDRLRTSLGFDDVMSVSPRRVAESHFLGLQPVVAPAQLSHSISAANSGTSVASHVEDAGRKASRYGPLFGAAVMLFVVLRPDRFVHRAVDLLHRAPVVLRRRYRRGRTEFGLAPVGSERQKPMKPDGSASGAAVDKFDSACWARAGPVDIQQMWATAANGPQRIRRADADLPALRIKLDAEAIRSEVRMGSILISYLY